MRGFRKSLLAAVALLAISHAPARAAEDAPPVLRGIVFVPGKAAFDPNGVASTAEPVDLSRVRLLDQPAFAARMRALLGQALTLKTLNEIAPLATAVLEAAGHPATNVTVPEQDVTSGIVQVVVTEFRLGKITAEGATHYPPGMFLAEIGAKPGEPVDMAQIQAGLRQSNANEYHSGEIALRPGTEPETVDAVVRVQDRLPVTVSAGYANSGAPSTGRDQWNAGLAVGNTVGDLDDVLSYQFSSGDFWEREPAVVSHSLTYTVIVPGGGQFSVLGNYSLTKPPVDNFVASNGKSWLVSPRFTKEVFATPALQISLRGGYDFKSTNNDLLFGGDTISHGAADVSQFELAALMARTDAYGRTDGSLSLMLSPGRLFPGNDDGGFAGLSPAAKAQYAYLRLDGTRMTNLPYSLSWWSHLTAQFASNGLLPSEQLNAGGMASVRGYTTGTARGDAGFMLSNELRFSAGGVSRFLGHDIGDGFQPFLFIDYADVVARLTPGRPASDGSLTSFGPGVRMEISRYATLTLDSGGQIRIQGEHSYPAQFFDVSVSFRY